MKKCIYIFLICLFMACERQPLRVSPMTAVNPGKDGNSALPVPGFYYPENFIDDKQGLKELMAYINDTIRKEVPFDCYMSHSANICKGNRGLEFEGGEAYTDKEHFCIRVSYNDKNLNYFNAFFTWSEYQILHLSAYSDRFEELCNYTYETEKKDSVLTVIIDYETLNMDAFQKFLNVAFYERCKRTCSLKKPFIFKLKNLVTCQIECIMKFKNLDHWDVFTIDIL